MNRATKIYFDVIVVGGGPAGMMAAGRAAELGAKVLLLEKNDSLGKKLKLTGGGRCNITNAEFNVRAFLEKFPQAKKFLYSLFAQFSAKDTFSFFENHDLPLIVETLGRAFPKSQKALDVCKTLERYMKEHGVIVRLNAQVTGITQRNGAIAAVEIGKETWKARFFILATGGIAAPETGSTGDGFTFLKKLGHAVAKPSPNIVPLTTSAPWVKRLAGTTCAPVGLRFLQEEKTKIKKTGKILFTHFGISGPLVLNSAYEVREFLLGGSVWASLDLFPNLEFHELDRRICHLFEKNKNKLAKNVWGDLLPKVLSAEILSFPNLRIADKKVHSVTKEERRKLIHVLKDLRFPISGTLGFEKAVITDGGMDLKEINFKTMQSRTYPNLFLLGDVLNINRPSGGYSLQLCWTTGFVAGTHIGKILKDKK